MNSFELNKIAGAVLGTVLFVFGIFILSEEFFASEPPEEPVYLADLAGSETAETAGGGEAPAPEPVGVLLASADAGSGEKVYKKCAGCHTVDQGGKNLVGPNLWNVVNRPIASAAGFNYSTGMSNFAEGGKVWDFDHLNGFLIKPKSYVDGTKMSFSGVSKDSDRADLMLYLRSLSDAPAPLPAAESAAAGAATETAAADSTDTAAPESSMVENDAEKTLPDNAEMDVAATSEENAAADQPAATEQPAETQTAAAPQSGDADGVLAMIGGQDPEDGEKVAKKCKACHTFEEGGASKIGPPLWNIVNRPVASAESFSKYSDAMKAHAEGGTVWSYAELDGYLEAPKTHVPGNKMSFAGLRKDKDRAAILAYLRTLSLNPAPLP